MDGLKKLELEDIKKYALGILEEFDILCKKNGLRYSIAYGTLLGAVRHQGFIPWDDDIDVVMPREDYEKLMLLQYRTENYEVKSYRYSKGYFYEFSKMIDRRTCIVEKYRCDKNMGVFIDIFPMDYIDDNKKVLKKMNNAKKAKKMVMRLGSNIKNRSRNPIMFGIKAIIRAFISPLRKNIIYHYERKIIGQPHEKNGVTAGLVTCIYKNDFFPSSIWDNLTRVPYENIEVNAFKEYDMYLKRLYGDYMVPPPIDKQKTHHSFVAFSKSIT